MNKWVRYHRNLFKSLGCGGVLPALAAVVKRGVIGPVLARAFAESAAIE
jgi:hypothetical protein